VADLDQDGFDDVGVTTVDQSANVAALNVLLARMQSLPELYWISVGLGLVLYTVGARHVPAAQLALLSLTEVVLAPLWVWLALGEVPDAGMLAGGGIVFAAVVGQALGSLRRRPPPALVD